MDWPAIARILGERSALPVALLDRSGRVRMLNRAMEQVLGWNRFDVEGQPWARVCVQAERVSDAKRWISEALRGALRTYETTALTKSGTCIRFFFEFSLVGRGAEQALLLTATRAIPTQPPGRGRDAGRDIDYEVAVVGTDFGQLRRLCADGEFVALTEADRRCHLVLYGLQQPCEDCPLRPRPDQQAWPRTAIRLRRLRTVDREQIMFEITTAEPIDDTVVRLRVRTVSEDVLGAIHQAKLHQVAREANLSQRERDVLHYLFMGRSIEDISTILRITPRTVKYHQANVLEKVGADSRVDLTRLLF